MSSLLKDLGINTNATSVAQAISTLGPIASDAFVDYSLLVAALTLTLVMLILVIFLTDFDRQYTVSYWSTLLFLITAATHFALLIVSYSAVFFGITQSKAVVILHSTFSAFSRTVADWVMLLRVRKNFGKYWWLMGLGVGIILTRLVLELIGRISWNLVAVKESAKAYVVGFIALTDIFFCQVFVYRFFEKMRLQREQDKKAGKPRSTRYQTLFFMILKEQNILPALVTTGLAVAQVISVDPNRYGAIHLVVVAIHIPFASVWRGFTKLNHDPTKFIQPIAESLVGGPGGPGGGEKSSAKLDPAQQEALDGIIGRAQQLISSEKNPAALEAGIPPVPQVTVEKKKEEKQTEKIEIKPTGTAADTWMPGLQTGLNIALGNTKVESQDINDVIVPRPAELEGPEGKQSLFDKINESVATEENEMVSREEGDTLAEVIADKVSEVTRNIVL